MIIGIGKFLLQFEGVTCAKWRRRLLPTLYFGELAADVRGGPESRFLLKIYRGATARFAPQKTGLLPVAAFYAESRARWRKAPL